MNGSDKLGWPADICSGQRFILHRKPGKDKIVALLPNHRSGEM